MIMKLYELGFKIDQMVLTTKREVLWPIKCNPMGRFLIYY